MATPEQILEVETAVREVQDALSGWADAVNALCESLADVDALCSRALGLLDALVTADDRAAVESSALPPPAVTPDEPANSSEPAVEPPAEPPADPFTTGGASGDDITAALNQ